MLPRVRSMAAWPARALTYDELLTKHIGQFGPGQWLSLLWASLSEIANAAAFFVWVFITAKPAAGHSWNCTNPADAVCAAAWLENSTTSGSFCSLSADQWHWTSQDSLVAKFNLVCMEGWKIQFANSLMFMGALCGSGLFGFLCDSWGRRKPMFLANALVASSLLASLAAPSYWAMAALRAVTGVGAAGQTHTIALLCTEPVGPDFRGLATILEALVFTAGEFLLVALAYALPAWQHLVLAAACINAATLLLYPLVSESARWLLSQGRTAEAVAILQHTAMRNRTSMPAQPNISGLQVDSDVDLECNADAAEDTSCKDVDAAGPGTDSRIDKPVSWLQVLRQRRLAFRLITLLLSWFALYLSYYGITVGSGGIPGSVYVTFAIGAAAEAFALMLVGSAVDHIGRHNIVACGQLLGGGACLACALVKGGTAQAALAGIGKLGSSAAKTLISLYTSELLPTTCRSSITGIYRLVSRLGSISAPFLLMLGAHLGSVGGHDNVFITHLVFGSLALVAGLLVLLLPETSGADMPETIEDLDNLQSVFTAKPWRQGCLPLVGFLFSTKAVVNKPKATTENELPPGGQHAL